MSRPTALEFFAGGQGFAVGLARAGFLVTAVDKTPHDRHPEVAEFITADTFDVLCDVEFVRRFDVVTGGPPCHDHNDLVSLSGTDGTGWMLGAFLRILKAYERASGTLWVVENVNRACALAGEMTLCGSMFDLGAGCGDGVHRYLRRHRRFASSEFLYPPGPCRHRGQPVGVYGTGGGGQMTRGYKGNLAESREAMGCPWMSREDVSQAVPPEYGKFIGAQLLEALEAAA